MRAEMEGAGAVDVLLELLGSCLDTKVQVDILPVRVTAGISAACAPYAFCLGSTVLL